MAIIEVDGKKYSTSAECVKNDPLNCIFKGGDVDLKKLLKEWTDINSNATHQISCLEC